MKQKISFEEFKKSIIDDFKLVYKSRQASLLGRKEVLSGKGSFGIFGDGKEVAQLGMAKIFKNGDFRSGYYRDQTFMMAMMAKILRTENFMVRKFWPSKKWRQWPFS